MESPLSVRYREIRAKAAGTRLIAVTKGQPLEKLIELWRLGQRDFGENYAQELIEKSTGMKDAGCDDVHWHFIGKLQRNKVRAILPVTFSIHSVDSLALAREIDTRREAGAPPIECFIAINLDGEPQKSGLTPAELPAFLAEARALTRIRWAGLMCIPDPERDPRAAFRALAALGRANGLTGLSMGMSHDYSVAIEEGSTHIRVGTALLGERAPR